MGLDMYLSESKYLGRYEYMKERGLLQEYQTAENVAKAAGFANPMAEPNSSVTVQQTVAYWRKAHAIHGWFVRNVQGGVDECQESEVTLEDLEKLLATCKEALRTGKHELIPPQDGFFFGYNREEDGVDEWYWIQIEETIDVLQRIVYTSRDWKKANPSEIGPYFVYRASW